MKKFRAWIGKVYEIEVESETAHYVTIKGGRREKKLTEDAAIFDTFEEARDWLVEQEERELLDTLIRSHETGAEIRRLKSLTGPSRMW